MKLGAQIFFRLGATFQFKVKIFAVLLEKYLVDKKAWQKNCAILEFFMESFVYFGAIGCPIGYVIFSLFTSKDVCYFTSIIRPETSLLAKLILILSQVILLFWILLGLWTTLALFVTLFIPITNALLWMGGQTR